LLATGNMLNYFNCSANACLANGLQFFFVLLFILLSLAPLISPS